MALDPPPPPNTRDPQEILEFELYQALWPLRFGRRRAAHHLSKQVLRRLRDEGWSFRRKNGRVYDITTQT